MKTKTILQTLLMLFFAFSVSAQQGINYKAIINDANGDPIVNTIVGVSFTILENGTTVVYKEGGKVTTDVNGILIANIGELNATLGDFNALDWGNHPHYLKTEINSGNGWTDMGTVEFKAVPYALYAKDGPGATKLNDLNDAKSFGSSVYLGPLSGALDDGSDLNRKNTALGAGAGAENTGTGNVFLGYSAGFNETGSNKLYINNSSGKPLVHGDFASKVVTVNGNLEAEKVITPDAGNSDMKAYIYGMVTKSGNKIYSASSDGFTVSKYAEGIYQILFTGINQPIDTHSYIVLATAEMNYQEPDYNFPAVMKISHGFLVLIKNVNKVDTKDSQFSFVVYKK